MPSKVHFYVRDDAEYWIFHLFHTIIIFLQNQSSIKQKHCLRYFCCHFNSHCFDLVRKCRLGELTSRGMFAPHTVWRPSCRVSLISLYCSSNCLISTPTSHKLRLTSLNIDLATIQLKIPKPQWIPIYLFPTILKRSYRNWILKWKCQRLL